MSTHKLKAIAESSNLSGEKTIIEFLNDERTRKGIDAVAGKFLSPDRMLRLCINAVHKTPLLMQCDPKSVLGAMMASAALGLEPNTVQQQAFLIPYKKRQKIGNQWIDAYDCQFQIGYRGFITLAYRSEYIVRLSAEAIHENDIFEHEKGSKEFLRYVKSLKERGDLIGAFCYTQLSGINGQSESSTVLPIDELMKIRSKSETFNALQRGVVSAQSSADRQKAQSRLDETPWVLWEDDMAAKSAIKKHCKQLPIAAGEQLSAASALDDQSEMGKIDLKQMADPEFTRAVIEDGVVPDVTIDTVVPSKFELTQQEMDEILEAEKKEAENF